ncbi:MAG: polyprenyl diphosphate synthase, partial [Geminicoccales bacterium]
TEMMTERNKRMTLTFAFNYGGRAELVDAARSIAREARARRLDPDKISDRTIARHLYAPGLPDPDLLVRTSGEFRISNYLLWQLAYAELVFTEVLWPDFSREDFEAALGEYEVRRRRFGGRRARAGGRGGAGAAARICGCASWPRSRRSATASSSSSPAAGCSPSAC